MAAVKKAPKKRKRKRKGGYKRGVYQATKCVEPIKYRSSWELIVAKYLDSDPNVEKFEYESLKIPYLSNKNTKKMRNYIPDFFVHYADGKKLLIEVKPIKRLGQLLVIKKSEAAKLWGLNNGVGYVFWTEQMIKVLKKLQK